MQLNEYHEDGAVYSLEIPDPDEILMQDVRWGEVSRVFSPAFWKFICTVRGANNQKNLYRLGSSLREELVACLLGGYGVTGDLSTGAFHHLKREGLIEQSSVSAQEIETALLEPIALGDRYGRYRYPRQKSKYIAQSLSILDSADSLPDDPIGLRDWLIELPGIGLKTASWIVRNWLDADCVAILDIHIHRAGVIAGFFQPDEDIQKNYKSMEERFVIFAKSIGVSANVLDNQIWNEMRMSPTYVRKLLQKIGVTPQSKCGLPPKKNTQTRKTTQQELFAAVH